MRSKSTVRPYREFSRIRRRAAPRRRASSARSEAGFRALLSGVLREVGDGAAAEGTLVRLCEGVERRLPDLRCVVLQPGDGDVRYQPLVGARLPPELHAALAGFAAGVSALELTEMSGRPDAAPLATVQAAAGHVGLRLVRVAALSQGLGAAMVFGPVTSPVPGGEEGLGLFAELADLVSRSAADRKVVHGQRRLDELTGLPLRRAFQERVHAEVLASSRNDVFAVLVFDLDSFRQINETLGTAAGDFLLRGVTNRLGASPVRLSGLSRFGEDSFACLLLGEHKQEHVRAAAIELLRGISNRYDMSGHDLFVTASMGVSLYPWDGEDAPTLLRNAELALHGAKQHGRNRVEFYSPATGVFDVDRLHIKTGLSRALEKGELEVVYQPKVGAESGEIRGIEALARWRSAELGQIAPARFIPIAEETGLILEIGEYVLRKACAQVTVWHDLGFPRLRVAVNVSGVQIHERDFVDKVAHVLDTTYLRASMLEIELTETVAMQRVHGTLNKLREISELGVRIAIDDFGTGYSSLAYLKTLPIDTLKIDQSFVGRIATSSQDAAVVRTVIALTKNLDLEAVAEGVETEEQAQLLRDQGCPVLQGFLYGRPMAAEALTRLLNERRTLRGGVVG